MMLIVIPSSRRRGRNQGNNKIVMKGQPSNGDAKKCHNTKKQKVNHVQQFTGNGSRCSLVVHAVTTAIYSS